MDSASLDYFKVSGFLQGALFNESRVSVSLEQKTETRIPAQHLWNKEDAIDYLINLEGRLGNQPKLIDLINVFHSLM
jgi:hypothetical protein